MKTNETISIALVDDDAMMRMVFRNIFESQGLSVLMEANNGLDFLNQLKKSRDLPKACLLDLTMPVMDGFETAEQLKEHFPSVKILAYSSNTNPKNIQRILDCGAHQFMEKGRGAKEYISVLTELAG